MNPIATALLTPTRPTIAPPRRLICAAPNIRVALDRPSVSRQPGLDRVYLFIFIKSKPFILISMNRAESVS
jgi:hypothetical protein